MKLVSIVTIIFIVSIQTISCSHIPLDSKKTYKKTLRFEIDGENAVGTYSASKKSFYHLEISTPQKPNFLKLTSCHQEKVFTKPGKEIEFDYKPDQDIESGELPCPLEISALEANGKNQWGIIDFKLNLETLTAKIQCNGSSASAKGSYICQSRAGLIQSIEFDHELSSHSPKDCATIEPKQGKKFYLRLPEGNCFYLFSDLKKNLFRLVTFGYNEILLDE